jgi:hypothetical protein
VEQLRRPKIQPMQIFYESRVKARASIPDFLTIARKGVLLILHPE